MNPTKVLHVSSATDHFLETPPLSTHVKELSEATALSPLYDSRLLLPRFGTINQRINNIHETIRLSGINIPMWKDRISLVVKVPSVRGLKLPIYFVDNEELFERKGVFTDQKGEYYEDNHIRSIFFCKSVLAIIEKLGWIPHLIHCHGWMTSFIPLYLKKSYMESHPLKHTKTIYTLYDDTFPQTFSEETLKYLRYKQLKSAQLEDKMPEKITHATFVDLAMTYADKVTRTFEVAKDTAAWENVPYTKATYVPCDQNAQETYMELYQALQPR